MFQGHVSTSQYANSTTKDFYARLNSFTPSLVSSDHSVSCLQVERTGPMRQPLSNYASEVS